MRSEKEMYDLILGYANADENIRAVILNGSRANPNRKPDPFNDFDIVYLVRNLTPCKEKAYYKDFGEILVYERTDESELFKEHFPEFVCYLMQFADGNRIDLTVSSIDRWEGYCCFSFLFMRVKPLFLDVFRDACGHKTAYIFALQTFFAHHRR